MTNLGIALDTTNNKGKNVLHHASQSESVDAIYFVRKAAYTQNLPLHNPFIQDADGHNAFWYADKSGNPIAIKKALSIPIVQLMSPTKKDMEITEPGPTVHYSGQQTQPH